MKNNYLIIWVYPSECTHQNVPITCSFMFAPKTHIKHHKICWPYTPSHPSPHTHRIAIILENLETWENLFFNKFQGKPGKPREIWFSAWVGGKTLEIWFSALRLRENSGKSDFLPSVSGKTWENNYSTCVSNR